MLAEHTEQQEDVLSRLEQMEAHKQRLEDDYHKLENEYQQLKERYRWLEERLALSKRKLFGSSRELTPPGQEYMVFNEAEAEAAPDAPEPELQTIAYTRRKRGQQALNLQGLPVREVHHTLPQDQQICPECSGPLHQMGEDVHQKLDIVPAVITVVRHICAKYACRHCQKEAVKTPILVAPRPADAFPNSPASPTSVAHVICQKFIEGSPLYRQEAGFERLGLRLSRQTMSNWMLAGAERLLRIYERMHKRLIGLDILHADETEFQVLREAGRPAQTKSAMWLYRSGRDGPPIVLYEYQQSRAGAHAEKFLAGFSGSLHVDGHGGYNKLPGVRLCGCWAHVRRKFLEAVDILTPEAKKSRKSPAHEGLAYCNALFAIERDIDGLTADERLLLRAERSAPLIQKFRVWLDSYLPQTAPKSRIGQAVRYCLSQWAKLVNFLLDGRLEISNNASERSIKPFVIGRKNWMFANTPRGAQSSAVLYSIVETAKQNNIKVFEYLAHLFEQLPNIDGQDFAALDALLPWTDDIQAQFKVKTHQG